MTQLVRRARGLKGRVRPAFAIVPMTALILGVLTLGQPWLQADDCPVTPPLPQVSVVNDPFPIPIDDPTLDLGEVWAQVPGDNALTAQITSITPNQTIGVRCGATLTGTDVQLSNGTNAFLPGSPSNLRLSTIADPQGTLIRVLIGTY